MDSQIILNLQKITDIEMENTFSAGVNLILNQNDIIDLQLSEGANLNLTATKNEISLDIKNIINAAPVQEAMLVSIYDSNEDGKVNFAEVADVANSVNWSNIQSKPLTFIPETHNHQAIDIIETAEKRFVSDAQIANWNNGTGGGIALGETNLTAYRGDRGKIAYDHSQIAHAPSNANYYVHPSGDGNLHLPITGTTNNGKVLIAGGTPGSFAWTTLTAAMVGLGNVTNESKVTMFTSPTFTGTVSGVTAAMVGLGNVVNESKATMFTSPTFTGIPTAPTATTGTNTTQIATTAFVQLEVGSSALLTKIKTVDGIGSGLDADLLDGEQGAFYRNASNINAGTVDIARIPTGTTGTTVALGNHQHSFLDLLGRPTTLSGYGITDAVSSSHLSNLGVEHDIATILKNGFMSSTDKIKLDNISPGANNYIHPPTHTPTEIAETALKMFVSQNEKDDWNELVDELNLSQISFWSTQNINTDFKINESRLVDTDYSSSHLINKLLGITFTTN